MTTKAPAADPRMSTATDGYPPEAPRLAVVRVSRRAGTGVGYVLLTTAACPYCGKQHQHGSEGLDRDGTYGYRVEHCLDHTHALTAGGRRSSVTFRNRCEAVHEGYVLVPAAAMVGDATTVATTAEAPP